MEWPLDVAGAAHREDATSAAEVQKSIAERHFPRWAEHRWVAGSCEDRRTGGPAQASPHGHSVAQRTRPHLAQEEYEWVVEHRINCSYRPDMRPIEVDAEVTTTRTKTVRCEGPCRASNLRPSFDIVNVDAWPHSFLTAAHLWMNAACLEPESYQPHLRLLAVTIYGKWLMTLIAARTDANNGAAGPWMGDITDA